MHFRLISYNEFMHQHFHFMGGEGEDADLVHAFPDGPVVGVTGDMMNFENGHVVYLKRTKKIPG